MKRLKSSILKKVFMSKFELIFGDDKVWLPKEDEKLNKKVKPAMESHQNDG